MDTILCPSLLLYIVIASSEQHRHLRAGASVVSEAISCFIRGLLPEGRNDIITLIEVRAESGDQLLLGHKACDAFLNFPAHHEQQRGNSHHAKLHDQIRILICIDFYNLNLAIPFAGQLLDDWIEHFAGLAPHRAKIYQHRLG